MGQVTGKAACKLWHDRMTKISGLVMSEKERKKERGLKAIQLGEKEGENGAIRAITALASERTGDGHTFGHYEAFGVAHYLLGVKLTLGPSSDEWPTEEDTSAK